MTVIVVQDDTPRYALYSGPFEVASDDGSEVVINDNFGELAVFTYGSKTVTVRGQQRTFTEQKRLFTDDFDRTVVDGWGPSPAGGSWGNVNGAASDYQVVPDSASIHCSTAGVSRYMRLSDTNIATADVRMKVSLSSVPTVAANSCSLLLGYQDNANNYRLRLTFNTTGTVVASIAKAVADSESSIAGASTIGTGFQAGDTWWIRGTYNGAGGLAMYAWKDGDVEPVTPTRSGTDGSSPWTSGRVGIRVLASTGATNDPTFTFDEFAFVAGTWLNPPVVTHNTWGRLTPTPFTGWDANVEAWLRIARYDTSPDILANAIAYISNAPSILNTAVSATNKLYGQSGYGPLAADGTHVEGSDFNDFPGIVYIYPPSGGGTTDNPEASGLGCMDCSGFVRMVFGFLGGLPMTRTNSAFFDGLNIPRTSSDQGLFGPGTIVTSQINFAPSLTRVRVCDVPFFDATNGGDETTNQLDHNGIIIGYDQNDDLRFISSRKSIDGPTFADLGGQSIINGTSNLYTTSLRRVRRY